MYISPRHTPTHPHTHPPTNTHTHTHTHSLPADFFDPGVSKEGGDGDGDGDTGDVVRGGEAAPATDNSESSKSSAEAVESESAPEREPVG